ncbi:MAG: hypothetical protein F8N39_17090 [Clostridiaceae bacterium]|nr:hypothetical protein [Clostridiaceae bacterium]
MAIAASGTVSAMTLADPIPAMAKDWWAFENAANSGASDVECAVINEAEERLYHTLSTTIRGLEAKLLILGHLEDLSADDDIDRKKYNTDKLLISILRDVRHLTAFDRSISA